MYVFINGTKFTEEPGSCGACPFVLLQRKDGDDPKRISKRIVLSFR